MQQQIISLPEELIFSEKFRVLKKERRLSETVTELLTAFLQIGNGKADAEKIATKADLELKKKRALVRVAKVEQEIKELKKKEKEEAKKVKWYG